MESNEKDVFDGKSFSELLKDIYLNSSNKKKQIDILINELRPLALTANDAAVIVPLIKEYLDVGVRNDEQLIKMANVYQKYVAAENRVNIGDNSGSSFMLTPQEKEDLLNSVSKRAIQEENLQESEDEILSDLNELTKKSDDIKNLNNTSNTGSSNV